MEKEDSIGPTLAELNKRSVTAVLLVIGAAVGWACVLGLTHLVERQDARLEAQAAARGQYELHAGHSAAALEDFQTALLYERENANDSLGLAEALLGMGKIEEARNSLQRLREHEPENGQVNLELARIAVHQNNTDAAEQYYHSAIYATWPDSLASVRQQARLELVGYLLSRQRKPQAQAELMSLDANAGDNTALRLQVADLLMLAGDPGHALALYRQLLHQNRHNDAAHLGVERAQAALASKNAGEEN
ncbi:tetratricopeptide repeat protein [Telmatobacter bradus]|uniref:tetratricopeptide repeat protein n=1 Tax=Telmatobacter bradus TaxID=474953 RepID=UPI003B43883D